MLINFATVLLSLLSILIGGKSSAMTQEEICGTYFLELESDRRAFPEITGSSRFYTAVIKISCDSTYTYVDFEHGRQQNKCTGSYYYDDGSEFFVGILNCPVGSSYPFIKHWIDLTDLTKPMIAKGIPIRFMTQFGRSPRIIPAFKIRSIRQ